MPTLTTRKPEILQDGAEMVATEDAANRHAAAKLRLRKAPWPRMATRCPVCREVLDKTLMMFANLGTLVAPSSSAAPSSSRSHTRVPLSTTLLRKAICFAKVL